ncbi:MAG TPA: cytochrome c nitrite reductase small subunit [Planctomycetota bacterium]|nr:cytochrome c nitrite reductase small subunit [Planctomycetota bacterium]
MNFIRRHLLLILAVTIGITAGLGLYTFSYAEGLSYFSSDPAACVNCHIMNDQYDSWRKSSHHAAAVCVDCHMPEKFFEKIIAKADNGFRHSKGFTLQDFHEPIQITPRNSEILQNNCLRCHGAVVHGIGQNVRCVQCHSHVGHGAQR